MATKNDITGDALRSRATNKKYADGWDRIFGKKDIASPPDMWYHNCKHDGRIHTMKGESCNWCGLKEDGTFD